MRVSLSIDCNGAAFYVADPSYELVRIFRHLADRIERAPTAEQLDGVAIADANGNTVGRLSVKLAPPETVAVHVLRADADTLADALARASERDDHLAKECENAEDQETAAEVRECVAALDRLADAIAAAVRQEGPAV